MRQESIGAVTVPRVVTAVLVLVLAIVGVHYILHADAISKALTAACIFTLAVHLAYQRGKADSR
jgi:hypothetical protein